MSVSRWRVPRALTFLLVLFVLPACGGGDGPSTLSFTVTGVLPAVSSDLNGGDVVTVTGTNFQTVQVATVTFGASPGTSLNVLSETQLQVRTPPSPGGIAQTVSIEVISILAGGRLLFDSYTYQDGGSTTPNPQTITPTTFTATGAEDFTIGGSNLGPPGGQVTVTFQGIGSVTGNVSQAGDFVQGRAPVALGTPPVGPITVQIDTGQAQANVPTTVTYSFAQPASLTVPGQAQGLASTPVRLADGFAVMSTAGPNTTWGDADDEVLIITGPPNAIAFVPARRRNNPAAAVGFLNQFNSIPAVLGADTICVYTRGANGIPADADDSIVLITNARTAPIADEYVYGWLNSAPVTPVATNSVAFVDAGPDRTRGTTDDRMCVQDFNLATAPPTPTVLGIVSNAGPADVAAGPGNFSIPFTGDGDTVFMLSVGVNGTPSDFDDLFATYTRSTMAQQTGVPAASLQGRPIAFSGTLLAVPGAGPNGTFGNGDDALEVFSKSGTTWTQTTYPLGRPLDVAALVPYARVGTGGIAIPVLAPSGLTIFTDPLNGTSGTTQLAGTLLFAPLGSGGLVVFGPGADGTPRASGDDQALYVPPAGTSLQFFSVVPNLTQTLPPLTDADRAFGVSPGGDNVFGTIDDILEVFQSRALGAANNACRLPASGGTLAPATGLVPFVPVGPGWGILPSPGLNGVFNTADDRLIFLSY